MFGWSLRQRSNPLRSRPAGHAHRYARPCLEELEQRNVMSTMYPGALAYSPVLGPTVEAYSPLDNVIRTYGDGFQTITGAYAPQSYAANVTGLFAVSGGTSFAAAPSNEAASLELGNSSLPAVNTQLPAGGSAITLLTVTSFGNNGGALLEVTSGENAAFAITSGVGSAATSLVTPFTPYVVLSGLPLDTSNALIALSAQSPTGPVAPGLSTDPANGQLGRISPGFEGSINALLLPPRATLGLQGGGGGGGEATAPRQGEQQQPQPDRGTPQEQKEMGQEMDSHMRLLNWDDSPPAELGQQKDTAVVYAEPPLDPFLLPPLLAELDLRDPWLQIS